MKILLTNQFADTIATGVNHNRELPVKVLVLLPFILHLLDRTMAPPFPGLAPEIPMKRNIPTVALSVMLNCSHTFNR
jgi:hypothetical protein